ncbi:MAG: hypothetical protein ABI402_21325 [Ferruginibacter sp.]
MKKIAFMLQSFALIALLPVCVALEMNHTTGRLPGNNTHSGVKEQEAKITILVSLN